jgi:hypothetical protein
VRVVLLAASDNLPTTDINERITFIQKGKSEPSLPFAAKERKMQELTRID